MDPILLSVMKLVALDRREQTDQSAETLSSCSFSLSTKTYPPLLCPSLSFSVLLCSSEVFSLNFNRNGWKKSSTIFLSTDVGGFLFYLSSNIINQGTNLRAILSLTLWKREMHSWKSVIFSENCFVSEFWSFFSPVNMIGMKDRIFLRTFLDASYRILAMFGSI